MRKRALRIAVIVGIGFGMMAVTLYSCSVIRLPFGLTINLASHRGPMSAELFQQRLHVPEGFSINIYRDGVPDARVMRFTEAGDLLVSSPQQKKIFLLRADANHDGYADGVDAIVEGLRDPHGIALKDGQLYIAETDAILRAPFDAQARKLTGPVERIIRDIPGGGNHWRRVIDVGPDGLLYLSVGSSCNVCVEKDNRRAAISRYRLDGTGFELFATGLRNSAGFAWQPQTNDLYATDNGRDLLGDDFPPCELDRVVQGGFYGWPYANGAKLPDPDYGKATDKVAQTIAPAHEFGAHNAPLGIAFYTGTQFPERYRNAAFVALHGSWNRSRKSGYKVVALFFEPDGKIREEDFITGYELDEDVIGRPAYPVIGPDGALYLSDDYAGAVYRIAYQAPAGVQPAQAEQPTTPSDPLAALSSSERSAAVERGRAVWGSFPCATCHDTGGTQGPVLTRLGRHYTIESLEAFLRAPQPPMPQFPMSDEKRRDLAIYLLDQHG